MGEQSVPHRNNGNSGTSPENNPEAGNTTNNTDEAGTPQSPNNGAPLELPLFEFNTDEFPDDEDLSPEEFARLDRQLDALFTALDDIEQKNDSIHAQLLQLLHANREIRQQLQQADTEENNAEPAPSSQ